jgi:glycosyltransferase involved in cell wall biosynthesis
MTRGRGSLSLVAISDDQRHRGAGLPWLGRVYNGVRVRSFPFGERKEDFVLFLGRCSPDKGMDVAIDVARSAGRHLMLAAKCNEPAEQAYFEQHIRPRLGPDVTWLGEVGGRQKLDLLLRARCLIFPIQWDEPFGMVLIEAMSCGTPVVALRRGSVAELIDDGVTGLVTTDISRLPELIEQVERISPATCRRVATERFDIDQMARGYEQLYLRLVGADLASRSELRQTNPLRSPQRMRH